MKNRILFPLVCFLLLLNTNLKAQEFKYGLVGGVDVTNVRYINTSEFYDFPSPYNPMISFNINGYVGYKSSGFWGFSAEPGFIQKGGKQKYSHLGNLIDVRFQFHYIQLPIYADFYIHKRWSISVGPEFAYLVHANVKAPDISNEMSLKNFDRFELSGSVGVNFKINKHFDIGLKYNHAFTSFDEIIWTDVWGYPHGESKEYNFYFQTFVRFKI
ncbi:MAG: hypothetical protein H6Q25_1293 [Bacteroidetes bacterium]|nr:hypothetical protein [Bacteroidota bacterium]